MAAPKFTVGSRVERLEGEKRITGTVAYVSGLVGNEFHYGVSDDEDPAHVDHSADHEHGFAIRPESSLTASATTAPVEPVVLEFAAAKALGKAGPEFLTDEERAAALDPPSAA